MSKSRYKVDLRWIRGGWLWDTSCTTTRYHATITTITTQHTHIPYLPQCHSPHPPQPNPTNPTTRCVPVESVGSLKLMVCYILPVSYVNLTWHKTTWHMTIYICQLDISQVKQSLDISQFTYVMWIIFIFMLTCV